jgi:hypothetical protein
VELIEPFDRFETVRVMGWAKTVEIHPNFIDDHRVAW